MINAADAGTSCVLKHGAGEDKRSAGLTGTGTTVTTMVTHAMVTTQDHQRRQCTRSILPQPHVNQVQLRLLKTHWKLKVTNTTDNAGITQSQAHDARYCQMQELNSLCVSK